MNNIHNGEKMAYAENKKIPTSDFTLLGAMHRVMNASIESHLERGLYNFESQTDGELKYLTDRLHLTEEEVVLFSILCEKGAQQRVMLYDIGHHLGCGTLETLQYKPAIDVLVEKGLVVEEPVNKYFVPDEVLQALSRNEAWYDEIRVYDNDGELYHNLFERFALASSNRISKVDLYKGVRGVLDKNAKLHFAKIMEGYHKMLDDDEFMFLLSLSVLWLVKGRQWASFKRAAVLRDTESANRLLASLLNGTSHLQTNGIIEPHTAEDFANNQGFKLTANTKCAITPEGIEPDDPLLCLMRWAAEEGNTSKSSESSFLLVTPDRIVKRQMFYNDTTAHQVEELATLLNEKKMRNVLRRLKRSNLRCGFTCLFHGGPGTGKTETVLQLARRTGRAVFQVEVSELRTRWHGESERLVKGVFDEYRRLVAQSKVAPIMLFNEADALFNRRSENPEHSSDKCENAIQNIILQELENLDGILIATTNLANNLDKAFERRFLYKVMFEDPDAETRAKIWHNMMPSLDKGKAFTLAEQFPNLAGGHIENITRKVTVSKVLHGSNTSWDTLTDMCRQELIDSRTNHVIGFRSLAH